MEMGTEIAKIGKQPHSTKHQTRVCSFCNLSATVNTMKGKENIEYRKQEPSLLCAGRFEYYPHTGQILIDLTVSCQRMPNLLSYRTPSAGAVRAPRSSSVTYQHNCRYSYRCKLKTTSTDSHLHSGNIAKGDTQILSYSQQAGGTSRCQ